MFQKKKKFTEEQTPEKRLSDRWDQQVFFMLRKFPQSERHIGAIMRTYTEKKSKEFMPSEEALDDLAELYAELQGNTGGPQRSL